MTNKEKFIEKANRKYSNKFDYSQFTYLNAKTKGTLVCPTHGEFLQNPDKHLTSKYGCPVCALEGRIETSTGVSTVGCPKYTWEEQKSRLETRFPSLTFTCEKYEVTTSTVIGLCPEHGTFETTSATLLRKNAKFGCKSCGVAGAKATRTGTFREFILQASKIFNNKYTYKCDNYMNKKSIVTCTCDVHGDFNKSAQKHVGGQGCPRCNIDALILQGKLPGGYCETIFSRSDALKNKPATIYYLKMGSLYKIGITINLKRRLSNISSKASIPIEVIDTFDTSLYEAYLLEQQLLEKYAEYRTSNEFSTELFTWDVLEGKILK